MYNTAHPFPSLCSTAVLIAGCRKIGWLWGEGRGDVPRHPKEFLNLPHLIVRSLMKREAPLKANMAHSETNCMASSDLQESSPAAGTRLSHWQCPGRTEKKKGRRKRKSRRMQEGCTPQPCTIKICFQRDSDCKALCKAICGDWVTVSNLFRPFVLVSFSEATSHSSSFSDSGRSSKWFPFDRSEINTRHCQFSSF